MKAFTFQDADVFREILQNAGATKNPEVAASFQAESWSIPANNGEQTIHFVATPKGNVRTGLGDGNEFIDFVHTADSLPRVLAFFTEIMSEN